jgi:hypothetical protein
MRKTTYKYARIQIDRSETTTFALDVAPWEVPVISAVNGDDRVRVIGETPVTKALPDPGVEYDRLVTKYKIDTSTGVEYVAAVYGVGQRGVDALAKEIAKAREAASAPPVQTPEYDSKDDPLAGLFEDAPAPAAAEAEALDV